MRLARPTACVRRSLRLIRNQSKENPANEPPSSCRRRANLIEHISETLRGRDFVFGIARASFMPLALHSFVKSRATRARLPTPPVELAYFDKSSKVASGELTQAAPRSLVCVRTGVDLSRTLAENRRRVRPTSIGRMYCAVTTCVSVTAK
jgi:hypothetical protein